MLLKHTMGHSRISVSTDMMNMRIQTLYLSWKMKELGWEGIPLATFTFLYLIFSDVTKDEIGAFPPVQGVSQKSKGQCSNPTRGM